jgi:uncharacterized protein (TIGR03089 family)
VTDADLWDLLTARRRTHGAEPLLTYVSGDERMELSAISTENGAAKVAGALADEFLLDPGARIAVHLPWHWQRSLWIGGIAAIGGQCDPFGDPEGADLVVCTSSDAESLASSASCDVVVVSLHPFGLTIPGSVPDGCIDASVVVRMQPDGFAARGRFTTVVPDVGANDERTVVVCSDERNADSWTWALPAPLVTGCSIIMCTDESAAAAIAGQERATRIVVL